MNNLLTRILVLIIQVYLFSGRKLCLVSSVCYTDLIIINKLLLFIFNFDYI